MLHAALYLCKRSNFIINNAQRICYLKYSTSKPQIPLHKRIYLNLKQAWRIFFASIPQNPFEKNEVFLRYVQDKILINKWCLIYDDLPAAVFHRIASVGTFFGIVSVSIMIIDFYCTNGKFSISFFSKLVDDFLDVSRFYLNLKFKFGYFGIFPAASLILALIVISRLQKLYLFRIYMNRQNPKELKCLVANQFYFRKWITIDRSAIHKTKTYSDNNLIDKFVHGQIKINGSPFLLNEQTFRTNSFHAHVLGETDRTPKDLEILDLMEDNKNNL